jgi:hypothetical protein
MSAKLSGLPVAASTPFKKAIIVYDVSDDLDQERILDFEDRLTYNVKTWVGSLTEAPGNEFGRKRKKSVFIVLRSNVQNTRSQKQCTHMP